MKVTFGVSTWLWTSPFTTETAEILFPKIAEMGYHSVEIPVEDPEAIDPIAVQEALDKYNLKVTVCGAFGPMRDLTSEDESLQQHCIDYIKACLDLCVQWKAPFFAGPMYSAVGKARLVPPDQRKKEWKLAVANLQKVSDLAGERNLELGLEPLNRFESDLINTCSDVMSLITNINRSNVKVALDGFHMNIEEPDIEKAITLAGNKLIHLQVSENYRGTPGTGQTRWDAYKRGLEAINYSGNICIESFTPDVKELAGAVCIWKPLAESQDKFAADGLAFLKKWTTTVNQ